MMERTSVPESAKLTARQRYQQSVLGQETAKRYRKSDSAKAAKRVYRSSRSKWETDASYLSRPIVAFDGEGVTGADGIHRYTTLAAMSSVTEEYVAICNPSGIPTCQCLEFLLEQSAATPDAINIIYGGSYDFNMMLRDFNRKAAERIYNQDYCYWLDYKLSWKRGKAFYVKSLKTKESATVYDVISFFQTSFVKACDSYLGKEWENRDKIIKTKAKRGTFTIDDDISDYNRSELKNLIELFKELRHRLNKATLRPARWDGPGAVAAALLKREGVKEFMAVSPESVAQAARHAYAGGRFEVIQFGHVNEPAYEYDINSAYPSALRAVPDLTIGQWEYRGPDETPVSDFALVNIEWNCENPFVPGPLFFRAPNGSIAYPRFGIGWYWSPEYESTKTWASQGHGTFKVLGSYSYVYPTEAPRPFAFIEPLYKKRQALKAAGDGAHVGIKLALNSLYGKLAQQVGARIQPDGTWRIPPFHQLEWAGYTTSYCRAKVMGAALKNMGSIIAFETDAVFSSTPLELPISDQLGDFGDIEFSNLTYVQSGIYFGDTVSGKVDKSRGVDAGRMSREKVLEKLREHAARDREIEVTLTRFITLGVALAQNFTRWRRWETVTKTIGLEPVTKRMHDPGCSRNHKIKTTPLSLGEWHYTFCPYFPVDRKQSSEFPVLWKNPNPKMDQLAEIRENGTDQWHTL